MYKSFADKNQESDDKNSSFKDLPPQNAFFSESNPTVSKNHAFDS